MLKNVKSSKILIVDDAEFSRCLISEIFRENGFTNIEMAQNGREALEKTRSFDPDLVLLDLLMPDIDGFEYCHKLRNDPYFSEHFRDLPILVQSTTTHSDQITRAFEQGATDFVNKPINGKELLARAFVHLQNRALLRNLTIYQKRVAEELGSARTMQTSILPSRLLIEEVEKKYPIDIAYYFETSSELGGDFWGMQPLSETELAFYTVDFSGHGVTAALNTFRLQALLSEYQQLFNSPNMLMAKLNNRLKDLMITGQFATMFYGIINTENNLLRYATAGALPAIKMNAAGAITLLESSDVPLGAVKNSTYITHETEFYSGDLILLYSDALVETEDADGKFITEKDIFDFLKKNYITNSQGKLISLLAMFNTHSGGVLKDDLTINIFQRR